MSNDKHGSLLSSNSYPLLRPDLCQLHAHRGRTIGRTRCRADLIVTRVPPAAWVAKDARGRCRSALGYLVCVAGFWLFKCFRYSHLNSPTMGASLHTAVPFRPSSQGLRPWRPMPMFPTMAFYGRRNGKLTSIGIRALARTSCSPKDRRFDGICHTTTRRAFLLCSGTS